EPRNVRGADERNCQVHWHEDRHGELRGGGMQGQAVADLRSQGVEGGHAAGRGSMDHRRRSSLVRLAGLAGPANVANCAQGFSEAIEIAATYVQEVKGVIAFARCLK